MSGLYDLGPAGCNIQNNLIKEWRKFFVIKDNMLEVDCSILTPKIALKASGHLDKFCDLMMRDSKTNEAFRVDHFVKTELNKKIGSNKEKNKEISETLKKLSQTNNIDEIKSIISQYSIKSPKTGNELTEPTPFNLMFQTQFGPSGNSYR